MEELKNAFYEVMYKYEKSFGENGVMANLNAWNDAKKNTYKPFAKTSTVE